LDDDDLGRSLPPSVRFTLAHELVHTFFFDRDSSPPRNRLVPSTDQSLTQLERLCDRGAAELLLPADLLANDARACDLFSPDDIRGLATLYGVSLTTLLLRMKHADTLLDSGALLYLSTRDGQLAIEAAVIHTSLCRVLPNPRSRQPFAELRVAGVDFSVSLQQPERHSHATVPTSNRPLNFEARCRGLRSGRYLLTLKSSETPRGVN